MRRKPQRANNPKQQQQQATRKKKTEATELQLILLYNFYSFILSAAAGNLLKMLHALLPLHF